MISPISMDQNQPIEGNARTLRSPAGGVQGDCSAYLLEADEHSGR